MHPLAPRASQQLPVPVHLTTELTFLCGWSQDGNLVKIHALQRSNQNLGFGCRDQKISLDADGYVPQSNEHRLR